MRSVSQSYESMKDEGHRDNKLSILKNLAALAASDTLTMLISYGARSIQPVFHNRPISWSVSCNRLGRLGLTHAFELDSRVWREHLMREISDIPIPPSHRWGIFIFNTTEDATGTMKLLHAKAFSAYLVDLDWTERLGQRIVIEKQNAKQERLENANVFTQFFNQIGRYIKSDRSLPIEFDMDLLIAAGKAVQITGVSNCFRKCPINSCVTLTRNSASDYRNDETTIPTSELKQVISEEMNKGTKDERDMLGISSGDFIEDCGEDLDNTSEVEVQCGNSESDAQSTVVTEIHELNPRAGRLFKLCEEKWFHRPTTGNKVGHIVYHPPASNCTAINVLSAKAEEQDKIVRYQESARDRVFWCVAEIVCSILVNVFFGVIA